MEGMLINSPRGPMFTVIPGVPRCLMREAYVCQLSG